MDDTQQMNQPTQPAAAAAPTPVTTDAVEGQMRSFCEQLVDAKQLTDLDPEVREQLILDLMKRLEDTIHAKIIAALEPAELDEFTKLLDSGSPDEQVQQYLADHIHNYQNFIAGIMINFRQTYLG